MKEIVLNPSQIARLFEFVESKYVRYKDVQVELVDHLASGIEEILSSDKGVSFDQALNEVYGRFPVTGFSQFVQDKSTALTKFWGIKVLRYLVGYLKLPKIVIGTVLVYFFYILMYNYNISSVAIYLVVVFIPYLLMTIKSFVAMRKSQKAKNRYLILDSYYGSIFYFMMVTSFSVWPSILSDGLYLFNMGVDYNLWFVLLSSILFAFSFSGYFLFSLKH